MELFEYHADCFISELHVKTLSIWLLPNKIKANLINDQTTYRVDSHCLDTQLLAPRGFSASEAGKILSLRSDDAASNFP